MLPNNMLYDIIILTENQYVNPVKKNWYIDQVLLEDKLLQNALENKGLKVGKKAWCDTEFDWSKTKFAIFRTTWDYFEKINKFMVWLEKTKYKTTFINSIENIKWNIDKHYLLDLKSKGINIADTLYIEKGQKTTLRELFIKKKWERAVIKPAISGAARETHQITQKNLHIYENKFKKLIQKECMLFQEFMNNIIIQGEISLIIIGKKYSHAVKKNAKKGDFRVQDDYGGSVEPYIPSNSEIVFAEKCVKKSPFSPIYSRVDIVYDNNKKLSLCELELIEPEIWFRNYPKAAEMLAKEIHLVIKQ